MSEYYVAEKFLSINGEGLRAGQPAVFIRFRGCNLKCSYCDTAWAQGNDCPAEIMTENEILEYILSAGVKCCTLTGGEPVLREGFDKLCKLLSEQKELRTEIETNGSADLSQIAALRGENIVFTMDYKLPSSGMEQHMNTDNFKYLTRRDCVKFVCGSREDLDRAYDIITEHKLSEKCDTIFSPVFGRIEPADIVDFILEKKLMTARMQLQLHKFIWDPNKRGV
ncbi:MAG: putative 7-carboxy-7-deazaguanine synthase QueE [Oscillospiraceae bacterium]|nr:putative 7-carboxy-7-deazaguanine synthase QueE [Oscillospiraceae bacterium]MDY2847496.1 putative 7-carboxy-7-deazaguanine synthase QueE [Oscillospiraceae bacterium]